MIELVPLDESHRAALEALTLPPEQEQFKALPGELLPGVLGDPDCLPVTILQGGVPVGLFVLSVGRNRDKYLNVPDPDGVALGALSLDAGVQGQGIGTRAMGLLPDFVARHFPQAKHVLLVVNQCNPAAKRVYEKSGFQVTGERQGEKGPQWIMQLKL